MRARPQRDSEPLAQREQRCASRETGGDERPSVSERVRPQAVMNACLSWAKFDVHFPGPPDAQRDEHNADAQVRR